MVNGGPGSQILVVDNNSTDGSVEYLEARFPSVQFISNNENTGFARANNQALKLATGKYILFLNPDTILPEDFFTKCLSFMDTNPGVGATGVQMIDRTGKFLKESKRGFPTPSAAFYKLSGLTSLFPKSKVFAQYYLGHIDENTNHEIEALSGACMLVRKEVIDKTGGFDERFFMYAEDIDLSFRIRQAGYKNFYLADTTIIHFKGESTTKDRRYVKFFYRAMAQFVEKHYTGFGGRMYVTFLKAAIWSRALLSFGKLQLKKKIRSPRADGKTVFLMGDHFSMEEIKTFVATPLSKEASETTDIILCEGKDFSFKKIIAEMKRSPDKRYRIHAAKTSGVV